MATSATAMPTVASWPTRIGHARRHRARASARKANGEWDGVELVGMAGTADEVVDSTDYSPALPGLRRNLLHLPVDRFWPSGVDVVTITSITTRRKLMMLKR